MSTLSPRPSDLASARAAPSRSPRPKAPAATEATVPTSFYCVACRKPIAIDGRSWLRLTPSAPSAAEASSPISVSRDFPPAAAHTVLTAAAPQVVFGSAPEAAHSSRTDWLQLSEHECLDHMYAVGDFLAEDFPLCTACWTHRLAEGRKALGALAAELEHTMDTTDSLTPQGASMALHLGDLAEALGSQSSTDVDLRQDREMLIATLAKVRELESEDAALDEELAQLAREEDEIAGRINDVLAAQWLGIDDQERMAADRRRLEVSLQRLERNAALEFLYHIDTEATVPTINGLRIGKLPTAQTPPAEINAACGQLLTLASVLRQRHVDDIKCPVVKSLTLNGDQSRIEVVVKGKPESQDFFITQKFFTWRTFGPAWASFASLMSALSATLRAKLSNSKGGNAAKLLAVDLPDVREDKVGGYSVRYGDCPDHTWTSGVREVLKLTAWCAKADDCIKHPSLRASSPTLAVDTATPQPSPYGDQ
jgi:hypothetical protein